MTLGTGPLSCYFSFAVIKFQSIRYCSTGSQAADTMTGGLQMKEKYRSMELGKRFLQFIKNLSFCYLYVIRIRYDILVPENGTKPFKLPPI